MSAGLLYYLFSFLFGEENVDNVQKTLIDFVVEKTDSFIDLVLGFYSHLYAVFIHLLNKLYATTFGSFFDFILDILNFSKDSFVDNGKTLVDGVFDKLSFTSDEFTENFIFWFIGLLIFAVMSKYVLSFTFGLLKTIIDMLLGV